MNRKAVIFGIKGIKLTKSEKILLKENVLGFDTETRPTFTKVPLNAPSIMQLAGGNCVFIFQLEGSRMFEKLSQVLSEKRITKCGVSVDRGLIELMYLSPFDPCSFIDLGDVARARGIPHHGLRGLAALLLKHRISKNSQTTVIMSDLSFEENREIEQGGSYTTIPTKNVLSIKKIKL